MVVFVCYATCYSKGYAILCVNLYCAMRYCGYYEAWVLLDPGFLPEITHIVVEEQCCVLLAFHTWLHG